MIAKFKKYLFEVREWHQKMQEGRELLEAIGQPAAQKGDLYICEVLAGIGLAHLRAYKKGQDAANAAQEMDRHIQEGPRPAPHEQTIGWLLWDLPISGWRRLIYHQEKDDS